MGLSVQMADGSDHGKQRLVREVSKKSRAVPQQLDHQVIQVDLLLRHTGQEAFLQKICCIGRNLYNLFKYTVCVTSISNNYTGSKERRYEVLIAGDRGEDFFVGVAVKDAAEKSVKAAVININHLMIHHIKLVHTVKPQCQTAKAVPCPAGEERAAPRQ